MLTFRKVRLNNFLTFQKAEAPLDSFSLIKVSGENLDDFGADSNDSGKSNFFNAITWCLFEKLAKTGDNKVGDKVVNVAAGSDCWVALEIELDGKKYRVTRYRKSPKMKNGVTIEGALVAGGKRAATDEEIVKLIGMTYQMFLRSVFWAQGTNIRRLTQLTDSEYKALFDELVETSSYKTKLQEVKTRSNGISLMIRKLCDEKSNLDGKIEALEEEFNKTRKYSVDIKKFSSLVKEYHDTGTNINAAGYAVKSAEFKATNARRAVESLERTIDQNTKARDHVASHLSVGKCSQCGQEIRSKQAKTSVEAERKRLNDLLDKATSDLENARVELYTADNKAKEEREKASRLSAKAKFIQDKIDALIPESLKRMDYDDVKAALIKDAAVANPDRTVLEGHYKERKKLEAQINLLDEEEQDYMLLEEAYGPAGLKALKLAEITPMLNEKAEEYSRELTGGVIQVEFSTISMLKGGGISEKYKVYVRKDEDVDFALSGGGMARKADIIAAFAVDDVREKLTGKKISLKIYDEATDGLDASGESAVVDMIRNFAGITRFFVSHKSLVSDNLFDEPWVIRRENGISNLLI